MKTEIKKLIEKIEKYETIYLYSHVDGDGDSLGSQSSMHAFLELNYPKKKIVSIGPIWKSNLSSFFPKRTVKAKDKDFLAITLDTANTPRIDDPKETITLAKEILKIDHHPNVEPYGEVMVVNDGLSSTCELLYSIFTYDKKFKMNDEIAKMMYIGILTDTGRFKFDNTKSSTFLVLSEIMKYDIKTNDIYDSMLSQDIKEIRFRAYIQQNVKVVGDVAYFILPKGKEKKFDLSNSQINGYVYALSNIKGVTKWMYAAYSNYKKAWKISLRSNDKSINGIAIKYNGGGHSKASGASVQKKSDLKKVIKDLQEL